MSLPELKVTVFSDYICPFCYVGHHRLMRLSDTYHLKINWCYVEIHPETQAEGEPVASLDYPSDVWNQLIHNLERVAAEENIPLAERTFTTNSRDALLLAEAVKSCGRETFYKFHETLFSAFFVENRNIGDREVLREIAHQCNIADALIESAWSEAIYPQRLKQNFVIARKYNIQAVPSFVFGERVLTGVVDEHVMRSAAEEFLRSSAA